MFFCSLTKPPIFQKQVIKHLRNHPPEISDYQNVEQITPDSIFGVPDAKNGKQWPKHKKC